MEARLTQVDLEVELRRIAAEDVRVALDEGHHGAPGWLSVQGATEYLSTIPEAVRGLLRSGEVLYHDSSPTGTHFEYMTLPGLFASVHRGPPVKAGRNQLLEWRTRLLTPSGEIELPHVSPRPLPAGTLEWARRAYDGVRLLFACRWHHEPGKPVPYSADFITTWVGIGDWQVVKARELLRRHVIQEVETRPSGRGKPLQLFLPFDLDPCGGFSDGDRPSNFLPQEPRR